MKVDAFKADILSVQKILNLETKNSFKNYII